MGKLNGRSSYQGSRLLENLEVGLDKFDKSLKEGEANIKSPFNKFYRVGTPEEIAELEGHTVEEFKEFENEDPCREHFNIVGYAIAKDEYTDQIASASGLVYVEITDDGRLVYNIGEGVFDLELSDLGLDIESESEDLKEDNSEKYIVGFMNQGKESYYQGSTSLSYKITDYPDLAMTFDSLDEAKQKCSKLVDDTQEEWHTYKLEGSKASLVESSLKEDSSFEAFMSAIEKADMNMITKSLYKISEWLKDYSNSCPEDSDRVFYLGCAGSIEEVSTDIENRYLNSDEDEDV